MRGRMVMLLVAVWLGAPGSLAAEPGSVEIAVLPLAAADASMDMYEKPVAQVVARHLGKTLGDSAGTGGTVVVRMHPDASSLPRAVDLVIDGRIVTRDAGMIALEAQVRDPEHGRSVVVVATRAAALARIDELAGELSAGLAPRLIQIMAARREPAPNAPAVAPALDSGAPPARANRQGCKQPQKGACPQQIMVVFPGTGQAAEGAVPVAQAATRAGHVLAAHLGFAPVPPSEFRPGSGQALATSLRKDNARLGLLVHVSRIDFSWFGVLGARGTVRVTLVDDQGRVVYDRSHRTDTVIGSRGDRHSALVGFVLDQAMDMAAPGLTAALESAKTP